MLIGVASVDVPDNLVIGWLNLQDLGVGWHWFIGSLLIFIQVLTINRMIIKNRMGQDPSLIPGLGYLLLSSIFPAMIYVSADLIAMNFFVPAVSYLFDIYKKYHIEMEMFNAGILIGIASLIVPSFLIFSFVGLVTLLKLRAFSIKELLQFVNAIAFPFYILWGILYLFGDTSFFYNVFDDAGITLGKLSEFWHMRLFRWLIVFLALAVSLFSYNGHMLKKTIQAQKKLESLYWILLLSLPAVLLSPYLSDQDFIPYMYPTGIFLGLLLNRISNRSLAEIIHLTIFIGSLANHYFHWW